MPKEDDLCHFLQCGNSTELKYPIRKFTSGTVDDCFAAKIVYCSVETATKVVEELSNVQFNGDHLQIKLCSKGIKFVDSKKQKNLKGLMKTC